MTDQPKDLTSEELNDIEKAAFDAEPFFELNREILRSETNKEMHDRRRIIKYFYSETFPDRIRTLVRMARRAI